MDIGRNYDKISTKNLKQKSPNNVRSSERKFARSLSSYHPSKNLSIPDKEKKEEEEKK